MPDQKTNVAGKQLTWKPRKQARKQVTKLTTKKPTKRALHFPHDHSKNLKTLKTLTRMTAIAKRPQNSLQLKFFSKTTRTTTTKAVGGTSSVCNIQLVISV